MKKKPFKEFHKCRFKANMFCALTFENCLTCPEYLHGKDLKERVLTRDDYVCQLCGKKLDYDMLVCHHLPEGYSAYYDFEREVEGCITLCKPCHELIHSRNKNERKQARKKLTEILKTHHETQFKTVSNRMEISQNSWEFQNHHYKNSWKILNKQLRNSKIPITKNKKTWE